MKTGKMRNYYISQRAIDKIADRVMSKLRREVGDATWRLVLDNVCDKIRITVQKGRL